MEKARENPSSVKAPHSAAPSPGLPNLARKVFSSLKSLPEAVRQEEKTKRGIEAENGVLKEWIANQQEKVVALTDENVRLKMEVQALKHQLEHMNFEMEKMKSSPTERSLRGEQHSSLKEGPQQGGARSPPPSASTDCPRSEHTCRDETADGGTAERRSDLQPATSAAASARHENRGQRKNRAKFK